MTSIILFITKIFMILALPASAVLLTLKLTGVIEISILVVLIPIIVACVLFTFGVIVIWQRLDSENFY